MADLDLTDAVEAAADALRRQSRDDGWILNTGHDWDHERAVARAAVEAAAPLIATQVRAECGRWTAVLDGVDSPCVRPAGHTSECHPEVHAASGRPTVGEFACGTCRDTYSVEAGADGAGQMTYDPCPDCTEPLLMHGDDTTGDVMASLPPEADHAIREAITRRWNQSMALIEAEMMALMEAEMMARIEAESAAEVRSLMPGEDGSDDEDADRGC